MTTGPFSVTRPDQLMTTPEAKLSKYSINILRVVKFIFNKWKVL